MNLVHFLAKIWLCGGVGKLFFSSLEFYFFCYLGAHAKFQSPTPTNQPIFAYWPFPLV